MEGAEYRPRIIRRRRKPDLLERFGQSLAVRATVRSAAVGFLGVTLVYGLIAGEHLGPQNTLARMVTQSSGLIGYSARHITIGGLQREQPATVLSAIGIEAGSSLIGFSPEKAEERLRNIDWVASASVRFIFPNRLDIQVAERQPFAIWQREGRYYLIDQTGAAMSADPKPYAGKLLLVTGEGAQLAASELVNHLESNPALKSRLVAAGRVGERRWNLYFPNGVKVLLPEDNVPDALARLEKLENSLGVLERAVARIDLRLPDRVVVLPLAEPAGETGGNPEGDVSTRQ